LIESFIHFLESNLQSCTIKSLIGFDCFGCGIQRATLALLKGDLVSSLGFYPALIPLIITLLLIGINFFVVSERFSKALNISTVFTFGLIFFHFITKFFLNYG